MWARCGKLWKQFKREKLAYYSLILFMLIFIISLFSEFIANDKPLILYYKGKFLFPIVQEVTEIDLGADFPVLANFNDTYIKQLVDENGWMIMPPIHFDYKVVNYYLSQPSPSPPTGINYLGTDDQGRDVLARILYGLRLSVLFGLVLTIVSAAFGIVMGAIQGHFGGKVDLLLQRFIEVWSGLPTLYILIILSSMIVPSFWWMLGIMLLFSWISLVSVVRAEFLKARNLEYVMAARALGVKELSIIFRHILPNAFVASLTFIPFLINSSITTLTSLDFLGLGLPPGSPSLGEMLSQGKNNLHAPWIGFSVFISLTGILIMLIFIGEGVRNILDPRR